MKSVNQWLRYARRDLLAAQVQAQSKVFIGEAVAFWSQQCIEKAVKAYLTSARKRFGKTHDIDRLIDIVEVVDASFAARIRRLGVLTPYAVEIRYPEIAKRKMTKARAKNALKLAEWGLDEIRDELASLSSSD